MPSPERFLHNKFEDLQKTPEVESATVRRQARTREKVSNTPEDRLGSYLNRLEEIYETDADEKLKGKNLREFRLDYLKDKIVDQSVIKPANIPEAVFLLEQRIAREEGHGLIEISDEFRQKKTEQIITDQKDSLSRWFDYLASKDADYPMWAKYWAFASMLKMGKFEKIEQTEDGGEQKEFGRFTKRTKDTAAPFPILNARALAEVISAMSARLEESQKSNDQRVPVANKSVKLSDAQFQKLLSTENFSKLYAQFLIEMPEYSTAGLQETLGKWVKYNKGSDPRPLVDSLDGYPLEWCTANIDTARTQLDGGDFYVYYSINEQGEAIIPRLAIRMQDNKIAENPRGIAPNQNLDPYISEVLEKKLNEFPDKAEFQKKSADMRKLTAIGKKIESGEQLSKQELVFLYEIDSKIEGFGYEKDPRVKELRDKRDKNADILVILDCEPRQIIHNEQELQKALKDKADIKAYVGELFLNIFQILPNDLEHVYIEFPEGKIKKKTIELGTGLKTKNDFIRELEKNGNQVSSWAKDIMGKAEFKVSQKEGEETLIILSVADLGFKSGASVKEIFDQANKLGLELCPLETGPQLRLQYDVQPSGEYCLIGMEPISDSNGDPSLFGVNRNDGEPWLYASYGRPYNRCHSDSHFAFALASNS